jgi:hypothetical protein
MKNSIISLRTIQGSNYNYKPIIIDEYIIDSPEWRISQSWYIPSNYEPSGKIPCTILNSDGFINTRYPYNDQIWFMCRQVVANNSASYNSSNTIINYIDENGNLNLLNKVPYFSNGTSLNTILPNYDYINEIYNIYLIGPNNAKILVYNNPDQAPIINDNLVNGPNLQNYYILNNTLFALGNNRNNLYQIGQPNNLPRQSSSYSIFKSGYFGGNLFEEAYNVFWYQYFIGKVFKILRTNFTTNSTDIFSFPITSSRSIGGSQWSLMGGRYEMGEFVIYISNTTSILRNTYNNLIKSFPFIKVFNIPTGWISKSLIIRNINSISSITLTQSHTSTITQTPTSTPNDITFSFGKTKSKTITVTPTPNVVAITYSLQNTLSTTPTPTLTPLLSITSIYVSYTSSYYTPASFNMTPTSTPTIKYIKAILNSITSSPISQYQNNQVDKNISPGGAVGISFGAILCIIVLFFGGIFIYNKIIGTPFITQKSFYKSLKRSLISKKDNNTFISDKDIDIKVISNPSSIYNNINPRMEQLDTTKDISCPV